MAVQVQSASIADRSWMPSFSRDSYPFFQDAKHMRSVGLPEGYPDKIEKRMTWTGDAYQDHPERYGTQLSSADIVEIKDAVQRFKVTGMTLDKLTMETFRLAQLGARLRSLAREVHNGRGFFILRGLNPNDFSDWENTVIYAGISSYVGDRRGRQDEFGNMLLHLTDLGSGAAPDNERQAPYSSVSQPFHTDSGSILGLYCLGKASVGGQSKLASSTNIYNKIARTRPDLIRVLAGDDWAFDRFGQTPAFSRRPVLHHHNEKLIFSFSRRPLVGSPTSPRSTNIPDLTDAQVSALNIIQSIAEESCITLDLLPGDCLFWNNLGLLHSRNGFTDTATEKRHLIRIWLHNTTETWSIPPAIQAPWADSFGDKGPPQLWPLKPIADREYISTQQRASGHS